MKRIEFYETIMNNLLEGVYFVDTQRKILFWSKGAEKLTGFSSEDVVNTYCYDNILNHIDNCGNQLCKEGCPLQKTLNDRNIRECNVHLQHKEGHRLSVSVKTIPLVINEKLIGSIEFFVDKSHELRLAYDIKKLEGLALIDFLTNLPNRRYFSKEINNRINRFKDLKIPFAVAFIDVDNFKTINDNYGHDVGDDILKLIAKTLENTLGKNDFLARWGGDEFIYIFDVDTESDIEDKVKQIIMLTNNTNLRKNKASTSISVGATSIRDKDNISTIVNRAEALMRQSKKCGKNTFKVS